MNALEMENTVEVQLERIMHVEDDESISLIARIALETVGNYEVLSCSNGPAAIRHAAGFDPQLLLLDVMMPEMDGPTTLAHLSELLDMSRIPIVFMTAKAEPADHRSYYDLGATAVIVKPFDPMALPAEIQRIWLQFND
jgi:CheY-like chemotaxis protein